VAAEEEGACGGFKGILAEFSSNDYYYPS